MTRYENWRELAEECLSSGMSVHGWCLEKGIPNSTCRQWIAKLKEEEGRFPKPKEVWGKIQLSETCPDKETPGTPSGAIRILARGLQIELDPFSNSIFLFCNGTKNRMKALVWDHNGFIMLYKRLDRTGARFHWPRDLIQVRSITASQLSQLLRGFSIDPPKGFSEVTARDFY